MAKILFFDLETAPNMAYMWSLWHEIKSMTFVTSNWYIMCWAAKFMGKKVESQGICSSSHNDKNIVLGLWNLLDEADIVVAHNAVKFDCKKINTRFIIHGLEPPSPYAIIDTLKIARQHFAFTSNRLTDLGEFLRVGKKIDTGGFSLWEKCMWGDKVAWAKMIRYCEQDIRLLEKVYLKLRPYIKTHPNLGSYEDRPVCPKCSSTNIQYRGYAVTSACKYKRFRCMDCGGWARDRKNLLEHKNAVSL